MDRTPGQDSCTFRQHHHHLWLHWFIRGAGTCCFRPRKRHAGQPGGRNRAYAAMRLWVSSDVQAELVPRASGPKDIVFRHLRIDTGSMHTETLVRVRGTPAMAGRLGPFCEANRAIHHKSSDQVLPCDFSKHHGDTHLRKVAGSRGSPASG